MTNPSIKILLIGNYPILRTALRMLVETDERLKIVGEISKTDQAAEIISDQRPDLILVDLPDFGGKELFPFLHQSANKIPVLIMVGQHEADICTECLKLGISGLVSKDMNADMLRKAIDRVCAGELWFDRTIMGETIRQMVNEKHLLQENPQAHSGNGMTEREKQVVELICQGLKNKTIAEKLFITETTVRHHLTSIFNKLKVESRLELVIYAFKHGMVKVPAGSEPVAGNGHRVNGYHYV